MTDEVPMKSLKCSACGQIWSTSEGDDCTNVRYCPEAKAAQWSRLVRAGVAMIPEIDADDGTHEMHDRIQAILRYLPGEGAVSQDRRTAIVPFADSVAAWERRRGARYRRERHAEEVANAAQLAAARQRFATVGMLTLADVRVLVLNAVDEEDIGPKEIADNIERLLKETP